MIAKQGIMGVDKGRWDMVRCGLEVMRGIGPSSVDAIVTDPPYGLEFMGKEWDHGLPGVPFWAEALRVAKPGCHLLAFGGTRTFHRLACAIEDAGWEIRDTIMWVYGSGFPKSHNLKGDRAGWGTALKPAWEPILLCRKPLEGTVAANVQKWGCGCINVDGCRVGTETAGARSSNADGITRRNMAFGMKEFEGNPSKGRWPANLIHDGSAEVLELFPETVAGSRPRVRNTSGIFTANAQGPTGNGMRMDSGSAARFFYCAKASRAEREMGCEGMEERPVQINEPHNSKSLEERYQMKAKNHHPTVKPLALMRYLCRLITPPNGVILDPFMGSGTTGMAAKAEGFEFIGIEKDKEYFKIAEKRIASVSPSLF